MPLPSSLTAVRRRTPLTLWVGIATMIAAEGVLFTGVFAEKRLGVDAYQAAKDLSFHVRQWFTPIIWWCYIIFLDGLITLRTGSSSIRRRPGLFAIACLVSVGLWLYFDWINFLFGLLNWKYIGLPDNRILDGTGRVIAFATVFPGMFLTAEALRSFGIFKNQCGAGGRVPVPVYLLLMFFGLLSTFAPFLAGENWMTILVWPSLILLLDPINLYLGRPSIFGQWQRGQYQWTCQLMLGGLICGFLWEFWNYWAWAKWEYNLPFLGPFNDGRIIQWFEMPLPGLIGFPPFAIECWCMWHFILAALRGFRRQTAPGDGVPI